jgi:hypothetical protein
MPKVVVTDKKGLVQETGTGGLFRVMIHKQQFQHILL